MALLLAATLAGCDGASDAARGSGARQVTLDDSRARVSYTVGYQLGKLLADDVESLDEQLVVRGLDDFLQGQARLEDAEMDALLQSWQRERLSKARERLLARAEQNERAGARFLKEYSARDGVVVLDSGLMYRVLKEGSGPRPGPEDTVLLHYEGKTVGGEVFDSSYQRGQPSRMPVSQLLPGLAEGVTLMREGAEYEFVVPPPLGFAGGSKDGAIGPRETVLFDVRLLENRPAEQPAD